MILTVTTGKRIPEGPVAGNGERAGFKASYWMIV
jgi:hypothetical protein